MTRDELFALIRRARSLPELEEAATAGSAWMAAHPDDFGVSGELESVALLLDAMRNGLLDPSGLSD